MSLSDRFLDWVAKHKLIANGTTVLLAVSGGVDSMAMAHLFLANKIPFAVAHCNFKLRGDDADKDELLIKQWCADNEIPFHAVSFDTMKYAEEWKKGIQETARILRYDWLEKIRVEKSYSCIATAHHANDNAETLLMNLFKGTGIAGLHGILPKNGKVIRPLLFAEKKDVEEYVKENSVPYRNDASNKSDKYTRNDIRLNIIPQIEKSFPNLIQNINNSIHRFAEAELLYKQAVEQQLKKLIDKRGKDIYIPIRKLKKIEALEAVLYELLVQYGFSAKQVSEAIKLLDAESGHYIENDAYKLLKDREFLILTANDPQESSVVLISKLPAEVEVNGVKYIFKIVDNKNIRLGRDGVEYLSADNLTLPLLFRRWRKGDYFYPIGMGGKKKKISKYLIDNKVPLHTKEFTYVLEADKHIVMLLEHRIDERFKVLDKTNRLLMVKKAK